LSSVTYQPYSDFALHHMGENLTDRINQGIAGPDEFRTAPLWGSGSAFSSSRWTSQRSPFGDRSARKSAQRLCQRLFPGNV
jgi:hypothetical protein